MSQVDVAKALEISRRTYQKYEALEDEVLSSAISFKFVQISENVKKLPNNIYDTYPNVP